MKLVQVRQEHVEALLPEAALRNGDIGPTVSRMRLFVHCVLATFTSIETLQTIYHKHNGQLPLTDQIPSTRPGVAFRAIYSFAGLTEVDTANQSKRGGC